MKIGTTTLKIGFILPIILIGILLVACGTATATATPAASQGSGSSAQNNDPAAGSNSSGVAAAPAQGSSSLDGAGLLQDRCNVCHSANIVTRFRGTSSEWKQVVDIMISQGAQLSPDEEQTLVNYLAQTYHP